MKPQALRNAKPANFPTLMFTGIAGSILVIGTYKYLIQPKMQRSRREDAERFANFLLSDAPKPNASEFAQE